MINDLKPPKNAGDISQLLTSQTVIDQIAWQRINEAEVAAGEAHGKPRKKAILRKDLLHLGGL